jgi:hypothetical protein
MYKPQFPYKSDQIILHSDRVMLFAKNDSVFILGKQSVGISTQNTFNVDAKVSTIINSQKIQLGFNSDQQVMLGTNYVRYLREFLSELDLGVATPLKTANASNIHTTMLNISIAGMNLEKAIKKFKESLNNTLSNTTYTK